MIIHNIVIIIRHNDIITMKLTMNNIHFVRMYTQIRFLYCY